MLSETSKMGKEELESFCERAEPNPFARKKKLYKMVRDIDDLDVDDLDDYNASDWNIDKMPDQDDANLRYVAPHKMKNYKRNEYNQDSDIDDIDMDPGERFMRYLDDEEYDDEEELMASYPYDSDEDDEVDDEDELTKDEFDNLLNSDDEDPDDEFSDLDPEMETGDGKYQGVIRAVKGAYLVSKLQQPDETFTEIWVYNIGKKYEDEANIRNAILSGTDIDPSRGYSEDNTQEAHMTSVGNVQFLTVTGLPD